MAPGQEPEGATARLRILVCQTAAVSATVDENVERWRLILEQYGEEDQIDIVQFPETAFSRYFFRDFADAKPSFEVDGAAGGPVFEFVSALAKRLRAYVVCGFMQKMETVPEEDLNPTHCRNSLYLIGRDGLPCRGVCYNKRHLFQADYTWCRPGAQDQALTFEIETKSGKKNLAVGLINCQEIIGDMDDQDAAGGPAARRLRNAEIIVHNTSTSTSASSTTTSGYDGLDVILFSTCWPLFVEKLPSPPTDFDQSWSKRMCRDFMCREITEREALQKAHADNELRSKPLIFSVACGVGSEENTTTRESWGGRERLEAFVTAERLAKRGCSGVKVYSLPVVRPPNEGTTAEDSEAALRSFEDVVAAVPPSEGRPSPTGIQFAGAEWSEGKKCMSYEVEEARLYSIEI